MPKTNVTVVLSENTSGNIFAVMGKVVRAMQRAGVEQEVIDAYVQETTSSGNYDAALAVVFDYVEVE